MANIINNIVCIGSGNVATHLTSALAKAGKNIVQVYSPNAAHGQTLAKELNCPYISNINNLQPNADMYLIAISDDAIESVAKKINTEKGIVVHTSGITDINVLNHHKNFGVFYPLQTFSKNVTVNMQDVPFLIEGSSQNTQQQLIQLAKSIGNNIHLIDSEKRKKFHLAAVLVNNFPTYLYLQAHEYLKSANLNFDLLLPLIRETGNKIKTVNPEKAQTGPARRKDLNVLETHRRMLSNFPDTLKIYNVITQQIVKKYYE